MRTCRGHKTFVNNRFSAMTSKIASISLTEVTAMWNLEHLLSFPTLESIRLLFKTTQGLPNECNKKSRNNRTETRNYLKTNDENKWPEKQFCYQINKSIRIKKASNKRSNKMRDYWDNAIEHQPNKSNGLQSTVKVDKLVINDINSLNKCKFASMERSAINVIH